MMLVLVTMIYSCTHQRKQEKSRKKEPPGTAETKGARSGKDPVNTTNSKGATEFQQRIGVGNKEMKENALYIFVDQWYGTPYKYGGCEKKGVDCSCFVNILYEKVYGKKIARSAEDIYKSCQKVQMDEVKEGDMIFFNIGGKSISHVGVYIRGNYFVHSSTSEGVVVNSLNEAYYKKYFFCAGKIRKE